MFVKSAHVYDLIYSFKDYGAEAEKIVDAVNRHMPQGAATLLDVGCGTGTHAKHLARRFAITGVDLDAGMLDVARERLPSANFVVGDMRDFDLGQQFDVVTCLFSAIGYVVTVEALNATLLNFARHAKPDGLVLVEPWFYPGRLSDKFIGVTVPESHAQLKVVRMGYTTLDGNVSTLHFHYMVGTLDGVSYFSEEHILTCFTHKEYVAAFEAAGLRVMLEEPGLEGRGLYVGVK